MARDMDKLQKRVDVAKAAHQKNNDRKSKKILKRAQRKLAITRACKERADKRSPKNVDAS